MNNVPLLSLCFTGLLLSASGAFAADSMGSSVPSPDSTGPTNPTPPTLPTPGTGDEQGIGTGIDGPDSSPTPGTDGTGREESKSGSGSPGTSSPSSGQVEKNKKSEPGS
jgi:hypothetical protein